MRTAAALLLLAVALSASDDIQISGSSSFYNQYSSGDNAWSEMPKKFWRWRFDPVFNIYGIPVAANLFVSSEESMQRQNMNRIYISSTPSASAREGSLLSWVSSIGIGASNPYFTRFTLNAVSISGVNLALNPGGFYFAASGGRNRRGVEPEGDYTGEYERNLYAVKTGLGSPYGSHLHLCMLYGKDENGSIREDSTFRITPSENWVTSLDLGTVMFDGKFRFNGEIAGSVLTRDTRSPGIESDQVPQWLMDFSGVNISSGFGWAIDLSSSVRFSENMLSASFKRVEPGFESMGSPYLRSDEVSIETRADRYFMSRQMSGGLWYRWKSDNLMDSKSFTTSENVYGIRAGFLFEDLPRIYISYSPSFTEMQDSSSSRIETSMISISANYRRDIADLDVNSSAAFTIYDNSVGSGSSEYSSMNAVLRETVSLEFPLTISGCFSTRRTRTGSYPVWKYTSDLRGTWYPSNSLSMTLGGYYTTGGSEKKKGIVLNGGFPICDYLMASLSGEYFTYSSATEKDYTNAVGGAGITVVW